MEDEEHPILNALLRAGLVLSLLALIGGFLGGLHPLGDSLSVGRAHAAGALVLFALLAIWAGQRHTAFGALLVGLLVGGQVALVYLWPGPPGRFLLYQKNLRYDNARLVELEADIRAAEPLAVTLQEVSAPNLSLLSSLADVYPHQHHCPGRAVGGQAILTRLTPVAGSGTCARGLAAVQVEWQDHRIWLVSLHLQWPWPYAQAEHVAEILPVLRGLDGPVLLAGDFNMVRWAHSVEALAEAARVIPASPTRGTFLGFDPVLRLPIDHAFAPAGGRITLRPALGSDHLGILAQLEP
ncbi:endonuclease/exonuclease/phosphatase family protein [Tabrizicola sp. YIM 78059]|uniref:endonuclease/exonuclease/phosphatase family protein n=1 Tax=Tabrizicola sp. YIM 78059 TaxID=2529861 RepID=UPI0010AAD35E|nr:endonuclease/exonuclease/phosphatase family protein [Tabrizicola sp. YIM 78059]